MIPCIIEQSLNLFTVTADERFNLGSDIFLRTHSTTTMRRFRGSNQIDSWTEKDFLESLLQKKIGEKGNRVYVLYGAAGSGKTEMIRWLQCQLNDTPRSASFLRISRTELDPVKILEKLLRHFTGKGLDPGVLIHWDALKNKPVTLANHLVWSALGRLFENDEQIIPISYKLRPIIEENLKQSLCRNQDMLESLSSPELISLEQLEALIQESCIHLDVDCEQLRHLMGKELEQEMLGGYNFSDTLRRIGQAVYSKTGHRPLLFIDDLVQSLNVYATELLDYFITLDEGNWDIILGLTPASFETTRRGKEILNRITNLDTFDDRITKLWFSDERGSNSFFLSEENCAEYLALYLEEAKRQSGYNCGRSCTHVENCRALLSQTDLLSLLPFNTSCIRRLFRKIPRDKGRPRHFITSIGETLSLYINHKYETAWTHFFEREYVPNHSDSALRLLFSVYSPIDTKETEDIAINPELVRFFFPEIQAKSLPMSMGITSLLGDPTIPPDLDQASVPLNPTRETIRDWLDEKPVNKELLRDVRQGIASVLRDIVQPMNVGLMCNSRPNTAVHKEDAKDGCKFALRFQGVDESQLEEVEIGRSLGHSAFFF